jgi:enhancing lycopene biosynthesis protein 2
MKKMAGVLSGCGFLDGAEVQEVVLTMLAFQRFDVSIDWFAPDNYQYHVIDHKTSGEMSEKRNVLRESARIVRGEVRDLSELKIEDYNGLVMPGGYGVAKNLCNFAFKGADMEVMPLIADLIQRVHQQHKVMAFMCIAPILPAFILGKIGRYPIVTIGSDADIIKAVSSWGASHEITRPEKICVDLGNRIVTTPAWNAADDLLQVADGINSLAEKVSKML